MPKKGVNGSLRIKAPKKPQAPKAIYSAERDAEFQSHAEREIFDQWFGGDFGSVADPDAEKNADADGEDGGAGGGGGANQPEFQDSPAKRIRTSRESYVARAPPKQVAVTEELVDSMESYVFDMQDILDSLGLTQNEPEVPPSVAAALANPAAVKTDKRNVGTKLPKADVDEVRARILSNQIMRDMTAWHDELCEQWKEDPTRIDDLTRDMEPNLGDIYDLSQIPSEIALLEAFKMATLFAYHCISLLHTAKITKWQQIKDVLRLLEPTDLLAKHCALKLWKNNWHLTVGWERILKELRADLADAKEWYSESDYMRRTIEFVGKI
ncbi:hypothetical protein PFICI_00328 [Pestalotiopsis fici W106-1]|uniref:Uncharacterized protein n=1 Tax=Pestalotiopsis fici (strain W106-1 / CGMCC3.15140) TaxID=1229662 RepID=W3XKG8_PESFW|nr:uncharacterized protein PFICI_00328 [Pestalotiopsis fici W106-1]ETS86500.1 hypothetical protein PFICI_00328 [Pestalotiopsis fici W106-1]